MTRRRCMGAAALVTALLPAACSQTPEAARSNGRPPDSFTGDATWTEEIEVAGHKVPCSVPWPGFCLQSRSGEGKPWTHQEYISGFEFRWGVVSRVRVNGEQTANPPADGSSRSYTLDRVISTSDLQPGSEFQLIFVPGWSSVLLTAEDSGLWLRSERPLSCADPALCTDLGNRRTADAGMRLTVRHPARPEDPLVVTGLEGWPP